MPPPYARLSPKTNEANIPPPAATTRLPRLHRAFGISLLVLGTAILLLEVIGMAVILPYNGRSRQNLKVRPNDPNWYDMYVQSIVHIKAYGTGLWAGTWFMVTGLLQIFAGRSKGRGYLMVIAVVMDLVTCLIAVGSVCAATIEVLQYRPTRHAVIRGYSAAAHYNTAKGSLIIFGSCVVIIVTLVHSVFACFEMGFFRRRVQRCPTQSAAPGVRVYQFYQSSDNNSNNAMSDTETGADDFSPPSYDTAIAVKN